MKYLLHLIVLFCLSSLTLANTCKFTFAAIKKASHSDTSKNNQESLVNKLNASWEITREGVRELAQQVPGMENLLYYSLTAMIAKENILVDGPGGAAKTFSIRKAYEAQLRIVNRLSPHEQALWEKDKLDVVKSLLALLQKDIEQPADKRIFTQQMHATLSETKILGGPNPTKYLKEGTYEIDYSKALISDQNMFAIIDEIEKAPVALQMTMLSILNERQALVGNRVIQTMLESIAATTNATLGELISQATPHEIGGRMAMIDRFALKVHAVNITSSPLDSFLLVENVKHSRGQKKFTIIDLRGLRPLLKSVLIPAELMDAMSEVSLHLGRKYIDKLKSVQEAQMADSKTPAKYYPVFSGSSRSEGKIIDIWKAAYITKQIMNGTPFDQFQPAMRSENLIELAPALLQGGPDQFVLKNPKTIQFVIVPGNSPTPVSNTQDAALVKAGISVGQFDPVSMVFKYKSPTTLRTYNLYFNIKTKQLEIPDETIKSELSTENKFAIGYLSSNQKKLTDINAILLQIASEYLANKDQFIAEFADSGLVQTMLSQSAMRTPERNQLLEIQEFHRHFLDVVNTKIRQLAGKKMTLINPAAYAQKALAFKAEGKKLQTEFKNALQRNDFTDIFNVSAKGLKQAFTELNELFFESKSDIKSLFLAVINKNNLMLFGPPGSGKTMKARMILSHAIDGLSEAAIAKASSVLSQALIDMNVNKESAFYIKQFHPMSTEGDIVGRLNYKDVSEGRGYVYNRTGSMSAKDVLFALLDEFEKAPPGVKTALLSILNERQIMDGYETIDSYILAVVLSTNTTPSEFILGLGEMSVALPIHDRIQNKAYTFNKLSVEALKAFHLSRYLGIEQRLYSPLFFEAISKFKTNFAITKYETDLLTRLHFAISKALIDRSDAEVQMHLTDSQSNPDFFMPTRGESNRTLLSMTLSEFSGAALLNRILEGKIPNSETDFKFDLVDLKAFAELFTTSNFAFKIQHDYDNNGMLYFKVEKQNITDIEDRLDLREKRTLKHLEYEFTQVTAILNGILQKFLQEQKQAILTHPNMYPSAFVTKEERMAWLEKAGFNKEEIEKAFSNKQ